MRFQTQEVVRGFQNMTYQIDGKEVQTKVIFVDANLDQDKGGKGTRTVEMRCIDADVIRAVEHNPFPLRCELDIEQLATKSKAELFVRSIRPLPNDKLPTQPTAKA